MLGIPRELPVAGPAGVLEIAGIGLNDPIWFPKENKGMKVKRGKINGFMVQCAHKRQAPSDRSGTFPTNEKHTFRLCQNRRKTGAAAFWKRGEDHGKTEKDSAD